MFSNTLSRRRRLPTIWEALVVGHKIMLVISQMISSSSLMRSVSIATCTSELPVSALSAWTLLIATVFLLDFSQTFHARRHHRSCPKGQVADPPTPCPVGPLANLPRPCPAGPLANLPTAPGIRHPPTRPLGNLPHVVDRLLLRAVAPRGRRGPAREKGDWLNLCAAPGGPFRRIVPVPFFRAARRFGC